MAAEKTSKRKQKAAKGEASGEGSGGSFLRQRSDARKERRYEPRSSGSAVISVIGMSLGAVALGAGVYAQWLRGEALGPHPYAPWLLLGGALLLAAVGLFGPRAARPIRVGDAGVAIEKDGGELDRIEWRDVTRVLFSGGVLTLQSPGNTIAIPVDVHPQAAARAASEAKKRIPGKVEELDDKALPALDREEGEVVPLEPAQVAGARCKASDKLIAFEKDARLCGRCGEVYHKESVPKECLSCEAPLR